MPRDKEFEKALQAAEDPKNIGQGYQEDNELSDEVMTRKLHLTQAELEDILFCRISKFTLDYLMNVAKLNGRTRMRPQKVCSKREVFVREYIPYQDMKKNLNLSVELTTYQEVKRTIPNGQVSSLVDSLLKEYFKKKKREELIAGYKSTARSKAMREEDKQGKEKELEIASKIKKIRPSLIVSNDAQNEFDIEIIVIP
ncbi:3877_t:CDS:2, partial [Entrophospora sp. SA101]